MIKPNSFIHHLRNTLEVGKTTLTLDQTWDQKDLVNLPFVVQSAIDSFLHPVQGDKLLAVGRYRDLQSKNRGYRGFKKKYRAIYLRNGQLHATLFSRINDGNPKGAVT